MEKRNKILLIATIALIVYWTITKLVDIYALHPVFGAIYEMTSILAVLSAFVLPIIAIVFWGIAKFAMEKQYILPLLISIITVLDMIYVTFLF